MSVKIICDSASDITAKKAKEWGADMLIVHEPTYYDHFEEIDDLNGG